MQKPQSIPFGEQTIECQIISKGTKNMLCFNGYGKLSSDFKIYDSTLANKYYAVGVNLPFHGNSNWKVRKNNLKSFLDTIIALFENKQEKITVLAYSIGARYAYLLQQQFPELIERIILIAPDGIVSNPTSQFTTFNPYGNKIMNWFIHKPGVVLGLLKAARYFKLISEGDFGFYMRKIRTKEDRLMLQTVWREVYTNTPRFEDLFKQNDVPVSRIDILLGKNDMVFPEKKIRAKIPSSPNITIHVCNSGHNMLNKIVRDKLNEIL